MSGGATAPRQKLAKAELARLERPFACVRKRPHDERSTRCGRWAPEGEFTFEDVAHALLYEPSRRVGTGLRACPKCCAAIVAEQEKNA
jgi:hypothetical protein